MQELAERFSLVDFAVSPSKITIDGTAYELHPLRMGDYAEAMRWVRDRQTQSFFGHLKGGNRVSDEVWSEVLSRIEQVPITVQTLISTPDTMYFLLFLSLRRGDKSLKLDIVKDMLPLTYWQLTLVAMEISGLRTPTEGLDDPFGVEQAATGQNNGQEPSTAGMSAMSGASELAESAIASR